MKQLLADIERKGIEIFAVTYCVAVLAAIAVPILMYHGSKPKPKELTPLDMANILTEKVNKLNSQIRAAEKRIETLERQQAGELPQIHGGVSYD